MPVILANANLSDDDLELIGNYETPFWGVLFSVSLMGITVMQSWTYFNAKYSEPFLRIYVATVVALDLANVIMDSLAVRYYFIQNYGDPNAFRSLPSYMSIESIITSIIVYIVHLFFASRVYLLTRKSWIATGLVVGLATVAFVSGILKSVSTLYNPDVDHLASKSMVIQVILRAVSAALCDVAVTVILYRTLRESRSSTTVKSTRNIIERLLFFVMTRGVLVTLTQIVLLILYAFKAEKLRWSILHFSLTRVYVISMVSMLNARQELQKNLQPGGWHTTDDLHVSAYLRSGSVASLQPPTFVVSHATTTTGQETSLELGTINSDISGVQEKGSNSLGPSLTETMVRTPSQQT